MSAIDWDREFQEPWRSIGKEWCEMLFAIANGGSARPPAPRGRLEAWDGQKFAHRLGFYRITETKASTILKVRPDTISAWRRGRYAPSEGRQIAIEAMFAAAEQKRLSR